MCMDGGYHQARPRPRCLLSPTWLCFPGGPICALVPKPAAQLCLQPAGLLRSQASAWALGPSSPDGPGLEYGVGVGPEDSVQALLFISAPDVLCHLEGQCRPQPLGKNRVRDTRDTPGARLPPRLVASPTPQRLSAPSLSPSAQARFIRLSHYWNSRETRISKEVTWCLCSDPGIPRGSQGSENSSWRCRAWAPRYRAGVFRTCHSRSPAPAHRRGGWACLFRVELSASSSEILYHVDRGPSTHALWSESLCPDIMQTCIQVSFGEKYIYVGWGGIFNTSIHWEPVFLCGMIKDLSWFFFPPQNYSFRTSLEYSLCWVMYQCEKTWLTDKAQKYKTVKCLLCIMGHGTN